MRSSALGSAPALGAALPAHLARELEQLDDELDNLKAWKDYAVAPKRAELIEAMEQLIGAEDEPKVLAARIKSLQAEWRTISRGIVSETPDEWERFHRASQAAYEPCRDYFAAEASVRQKNLEDRKALLERLTAYENTLVSDGADYRLLARVMREAPQEWRRYFPVDRDANRTVQVAFDESLRRLQARLTAWHDDNAAAKQALIAQARQLLSQDSRAAIDAVKRLQSLWRETGSATRDMDQSLWTEFRDLCDAIFDKRRQAHAEFAAGIEINTAQAVALCETAENVAKMSGKDLIEGVGKIPEWRAAFDAASELLGSQQRGLEQRFERAIASCEAQRQRLQARDAEDAVAHLFAATRHVRAVEWAVVQGAAPAQLDALRHAADAYIAAVTHWPKGGLQAVKEALAKAGSASEAGRDAREQCLRLLCVRAEVNADKPTPTEDDALRRDFQVQRLMRGMGQGHRGEDRHEMMLEWVSIGAVSPALYDNLAARFIGAR
jgi:nucleotidyltransferase/DNA polymerase involved in DNA repair